MNSTRDVRKQLIDILLERVENHKDKIVSPIIYNELLGMEVKRNGKIEHSDSTHDDQVFSMLMALWVWYEGTNLGERYGIRKTSIKTDDEVDEPIDYFNDDTVDIVGSFNTQDELAEEIERDIKAAIAAGGVAIDEFLERRRAEEKAQFEALVHTPLGEKAYRELYNIPRDEPIEKYVHGGETYTFPEHVFASFYNPTDALYRENDSDRPSPSAVPASQASTLEDEDYSYRNYFNF